MKEDLVYFVHGTHAGVSAFLQAESDATHRNANFVAVGALVPLSYGRLGRNWLHANQLKRLAKSATADAEDIHPLELYWGKYRQDEADSRSVASTSASRHEPLPPGLDHKRKRPESDNTTRPPNRESLLPDHPALSVLELLTTFGPLLFPLYRAALLRKRILILGTPPVQQSCNFVYLLSILSSIPHDLSDTLQPDTGSLLRSQTLFNVGVHDISALSDRRRNARWLACTTDDILGEKKDLSDVLVSLPTKAYANRKQRWPEIRTSDGRILKATQRDSRRYGLLHSELERIRNERKHYRDDLNTDDGDEVSPLTRASTAALLSQVKHSESGEADVVEPVSWTAMAYNGFMWWASAGEMEAWENEEVRTDRQLLDDIPHVDDLVHHIGSGSEQDEEQELVRHTSVAATIVTAYFHRLTAQIISPLASLVEDADDEAEEGTDDSAISITSDDVRAMGLDTWSADDVNFVQSAMELYFGRGVVLDQAGTRICGVKIC